MMGPREPVSTDRDRALVEAVLAHVPGAFEELVRIHQGLCWHIIRRMVRDPEVARELCQDTFLRVHRYLNQYRFESSLRSWVSQVAYSVAARHLKRKRIPLIAATDERDGGGVLLEVGDTFNLESAYADAELIAHVRKAIDELAPAQRAMLTMYHLEEMSIREIADVVGMSEGTVKSHLFRGRAVLRARLQRLMESRP